MARLAWGAPRIRCIGDAERLSWRNLPLLKIAPRGTFETMIRQGAETFSLLPETENLELRLCLGAHIFAIVDASSLRPITSIPSPFGYLSSPE